MQNSSAGDNDISVSVGPDRQQLKCLICGATQFRKHVRLLNTRWLTLFKLDWTNRSATLYTCAKCGFIHWFAEPGSDALKS